MKPGSVVYVGEAREEPIKLSVIDYSADTQSEFPAETAADLTPLRTSQNTSWIDASGIHDAALLENIGEQFGLHTLLIEDIANSGVRPKYEEGDGHIALIVKMLYRDEAEELKSEQVSVVFGERWVLSFQETGHDVLDPVRDRIRKTIPRSRLLHADYLGYSLVDAIVDHYFVVLEHISDEVERLEDKMIDDPQREDLERIYELKREMAFIRKSVWPLREAISAFERTENSLLSDVTRPYLRDLYEHVIQVIDTVETLRDMVSGLLDFYLSSVSNRMNEVMKVLTIIATIFIPLGFLAGVYGMNFDTSSPFNLPELGYRYGYITFWGLVLVIGGGLFLFFKKKRWL